MDEFSRRDFIAGAVAACGALATNSSDAAAPLSGKQGPGVYRFRLGDYELTALYDGTWLRKIDDKFVRNATPAQVNQALARAFLAPGIVPTPFTPLLVNTGKQLILIDTGTQGQLAPTTGLLASNFAAAGIDPNAIDTILISHFHPDHINGIKDKEGKRLFPNAEIFVPEPEWPYWMDDATLSRTPADARAPFLNARRIFNDIAKELVRYTPGEELAPGITSIAAYGHTPGHTAFAIHSKDQSLLILSDTTNHPWLFARHPEWQGIFDVDGKQAVATRRRLLDRAVADKMLVTGYHFPFPATGHIAKAGTGYDFVPMMWQPF